MKRVFWIDCARFVAIILVVFTHAHERADITSDIIKSIFYSIDRIGVPIFFMLSGGLVLPKIHATPILAFYKKRIPQFIVLLFIYSIATNFFSMYLKTGQVYNSLVNAIANHNGIIPANYGSATQMWFMYSIIQLYLVAPFIARLVVTLKTKEIMIFLVICLLLTLANRTIAALGGEWRFISRMGIDFTGAYLAYFLTGYLIINRGILNCRLMKINSFNCLLIFIPVIVVFFIDKHSGKLVDSLHWYSSSLFIYTSSIGAIAIIKNVAEGRWNTFISLIGNCSFGIYLVHYIFIIIFGDLCGLVGLGWVSSMLLIFIFSFILSVGYTYLMSKNKLTRYLSS